MLSLAISAMSANLDLWNFYFNDFITHKLKLVDLGHTPQSHTLQGDFAQQILCTYLEELHVHEAPRRMAQLHCYVGTYQLQLAQMAAILRPLSKIERVRREGEGGGRGERRGGREGGRRRKGGGGKGGREEEGREGGRRREGRGRRGGRGRDKGWGLRKREGGGI